MDKMKKFFIYNTILSFILISSLYFLSSFYSRFIDTNSVKFLELNKIPARSLDIVNLGSSHGCYGIKYPQNIKGYNLALSGQIFYYDYEVLKKYSNKLKKNCVIVFPISIFSFYSGYDVENIGKKYIPFINREKIIGINIKEYYLIKYFSITQPLVENMRSTLKYIKKSIKKRKIVKTYITYPKNLSLKEKRIEAKNTALNHLGIKHKKNLHNKNIGINQLKEMIEFCYQNNFIPILIITPQTYLYNDEIGDKNYQERIYNNINQVKKELGRDILYLDYSHDSRFTNNLEYFFDDDHLNEKGAEYFTKILLNDLRERGYKF